MHKEILIIGAGQCGLAAGRFLQIKKKDFLILEKNKQVGDNWRKRYDSLTLFTPAAYSALPDLPMALSPQARPNKNQMADYFNRYVDHFELPVSVNEEVVAVSKENGVFITKTGLGEITSDKLIIANGLCRNPHLPSWVDKLEIPYLHSSEYKSPISIKGKKVLVVGSGNSAAQIAAELTKYYTVHWSTASKPKFTSLHFLGKNILWIADKLGKLDKQVSEKKIKYGEPIYLFEDLKKLLKKTKSKKKVTEAVGNTVTFEGGAVENYDMVVLATGFTPEFGFINISEFENDLEQLRIKQGVSQVPGLYFLGIPYQRSRSSHLIYGSQKDASYMVDAITG